jgi:hypothetical protein
MWRGLEDRPQRLEDDVFVVGVTSVGEGVAVSKISYGDAVAVGSGLDVVSAGMVPVAVGGIEAKVGSANCDSSVPVTDSAGEVAVGSVPDWQETKASVTNRPTVIKSVNFRFI